MTCGRADSGKSTLVQQLHDHSDRSFDTIDLSGGDQFTLNMMTFGLTTDLAIILIDADKGVIEETRRYSYIAHLLGVRSIILAVNKMDLVDYDQHVFDGTLASFQKFAGSLGFQQITGIPISAVECDNVAERSERMPWYAGPTVVECLGATPMTSELQKIDGCGGEGVIATDQVQAHLIWMSEEPMIPGRQYILKRVTQSATAWVSELKYAVNVETMEHTAVKTLELDDIGVCNLSFDRRIACDAYSNNHVNGSFILVDRFTNTTVGFGLIDFSLRRARNLTLQTLTLDKNARAQSMGQKPVVIWFTGLSGAGKSTVANAVESKLFEKGHRTYLLDGDNVRHGLNRDLGFTDADRVENIRRFGEVAKLFADAGLIVLVSVISPFRSERDMARGLMDDGEFVEVFVDASLETCEDRDPKGLYARARKGEIRNFTGIDSPYESPLNPELVLDTDALSPDAAADQVIALIEAKILED